MEGPARLQRAIEVPELGPSLGRLSLPAKGYRIVAGDAGRAPPGIALDAVRLELASDLFDLAGQARAASAQDPESAIGRLGHANWLAAWERAVHAATALLVQGIDARLRSAAAEARMPSRRLRALLVSPAESRAVAARLGSEGGTLIAALDQLEESVTRLQTPGWLEIEGPREWQEEVATAARRTEAAWLALEAAAKREWDGWSAEVEQVRSWKRPRWPLWVATGVLGCVATYFGLILGGYLRAPAALQAVVTAWWSWF